MAPGQRHMQAHELELRGFNRSLAEIEWLLLVLILAYVVVPSTRVGQSSYVVLACALFALFVIGFRYLNLFRLEAPWKLTLETWAMIVLTAFVVWHTGKIASPLNNLYLLAIIFSALSLGKVVTLLQVGLIAALYLHASYGALGGEIFAYRTFSNVLLNFAPFVLVAYLTSLLAADMSHARESIQRLSETDELTGLPNMRAFNTILERQCEQARAQGESFGVMMIDADELKPINDELGHRAGNEMILHVAASIRRGLRDSDVVARFGGDEFVVLLPGADDAATGEIAERVRRAVANSAVDVGGRSLSVTVSIGYAVFPDMADTPRDLLGCADRALYECKHGGRDRARGYRVGRRGEADIAE